MESPEYKKVNSCYQKVLGRMVDDDGFRTYKHFDPCELEAILAESDEYLHNIKKRVPPKKVNNTPPKIPTEGFDIVVARYSEDPSFLDNFAQFQCRVFLYNKGDIITHRFSSNVIIINIPNVSFEEYAYLTHITTNYHNMRPTVFMQCAMDHCPDILNFLSAFETFGEFESMSQGLGIKDFAENSFEKESSRFGIWYKPNTLDFSTIKYIFKGLDDWEYPDDIDPISFIEKRYGVNVGFKYFAPGAQVFIRDVTKYDISTYNKLKSDIETLDTFGRHVSSRFQEFLERYFWSSVWTVQNSDEIIRNA